jgi:hypothetical protein
VKKTHSPRFEVDFKTRLAQREAANNAVRLPRLGYALYRVYDIVEKKDKKELNFIYGSKNSGKSSYAMTLAKSRQIGKSQALLRYYQAMYSSYQVIIDDLITALDESYKVKWLKPKHVTLLKMKGHRVEPTDFKDKSKITQGNKGPVRVGI